VLLYIK